MKKTREKNQFRNSIKFKRELLMSRMLMMMGQMMDGENKD